MKKILFLLVLLIGFFTNGQTPVVDGVQYAKHYSTSEMNAIPSPANGRYIYNSDTNSLWRFDGSVWAEASGSGGSGTVAFSTITGSPHDNANLGQSLDSTVHKWGNETIDSVKTFLRPINTITKRDTVVGKNIRENIITRNGIPFLSNIVKNWNGTTWTSDGNYVGLGNYALANNTGHYVVALGEAALRDNTGANTVGVGYFAGYLSTGSGNYIGYFAGSSNSGAGSSFIGYRAGTSNSGTYSNGMGHFALGYNTGAYSSGIGYQSLLYNAGANSNGFGFQSLQKNNGDRNNGFGNYTLQYAKGTDNNVFGNSSYSEFIPNISGNKTFGTSDVNTGTDQITVTAHSFGTTGAIVNLKLSGAGVALGTGMGDGSVNKWEVIDANTLKAKFVDITSTGTGTMTLTPQFAYSNVNILGNNLQPTQSDQTILGGATVIGPNTNKAAGIAGGNKVFLTREMGDQLYTGGGGGGTITLPLDATDIADGSVTNTEFQYMNTVTSNIQTQLDGKLDPTDILDEDDMLSNSDTHVPSQQSVKAYVDNGLSPMFKKDGSVSATGNFDLGGNNIIGINAILAEFSFGVLGSAPSPFSINSNAVYHRTNIPFNTGWATSASAGQKFRFGAESAYGSNSFPMVYTLDYSGSPVSAEDLTPKSYVDAQLSSSGTSEVAERSLNAGKYHFTSTASNETLTSALVEPATPNLGKKMWRTYTANDTITVPGNLPVGWSSVIEAGSATDSILIKADTGVDIYGQGNSFVQSGTGIDGLWLKKGRTVALVYKGANSVRAEGPWNVAAITSPEQYTTANALSINNEANSSTGVTKQGTGSGAISIQSGGNGSAYFIRLTTGGSGASSERAEIAWTVPSVGNYTFKVDVKIDGSSGYLDQWTNVTKIGGGTADPQDGGAPDNFTNTTWTTKTYNLYCSSTTGIIRVYGADGTPVKLVDIDNVSITPYP